MIRSIYLFAAFLFFVSACGSLDSIDHEASTNTLIEYQHQIEPGFLQSHLEVIAHDSLMGRGTATAGLQRAAKYLSDFYSELDFTPMGDNDTYFQHFDLTTSKVDSLVYTTYQISGSDTTTVNRSVETPDQVGVYSGIMSGYQKREGPIVFAGFGIDDPHHGIQHLDPALLENAWVMIYEELPDRILNNPAFPVDDYDLNLRVDHILSQYNASGVLLISDFPSELYHDIIGVNSIFHQSHGRLSLTYLDQSQPTDKESDNVKYVNPEMAVQLLNLEKEADILTLKDSISQDLGLFRSTPSGYLLKYEPYYPGTIQTENVVAFLEGSDPQLKDEAVVLMAHYDHMGIETSFAGEELIYNGADDNGSGTVALMAIADALHEAAVQGYRTRRSILFLHVSAEELGLLGSRYYSDHPVVPIDQTIAAFNADMIGRSDPENIALGDTDYVYLIGGEIISSGLDSLVVLANDRSANMRLDRKYNDLTDRSQFYRRSDHWNLGRLGVPFVFFFTGVHEDYHQPTDTIDKIDFSKYNRVVQLIYTSVIQTANSSARPVVDNDSFIDLTQARPR
tara:strand:+ start:15839 stop:17533 length:1695 start_codon:yes stop_codon:yes gene_type:complete